MVEGKVVKRSKETENKELKTGLIEIKIENIKVLSKQKNYLLPVFGEQDYPEETRLKYRFIDFRSIEMYKKKI